MSLDSVKSPLIFDDDSRMRATEMTNYSYVINWKMLYKMLKIKKHDNLLTDTYDRNEYTFYANSKIITEHILIGSADQIFRFKELSIEWDEWMRNLPYSTSAQAYFNTYNTSNKGKYDYLKNKYGFTIKDCAALKSAKQEVDEYKRTTTFAYTVIVL